MFKSTKKIPLFQTTLLSISEEEEETPIASMPSSTANPSDEGFLIEKETAIPLLQNLIAKLVKKQSQLERLGKMMSSDTKKSEFAADIADCKALQERLEAYNNTKETHFVVDVDVIKKLKMQKYQLIGGEDARNFLALSGNEQPKKITLEELKEAGLIQKTQEKLVRMLAVPDVPDLRSITLLRQTLKRKKGKPVVANEENCTPDSGTPASSPPPSRPESPTHGTRRIKIEKRP